MHLLHLLFSTNFEQTIDQIHSHLFSYRTKVACFNFVHVLISPSFTKTMILAFLPIESMFQRCIAIDDFTELKQVRCKCKTICFSRILHWRNYNAKNACKFQTHTLLEPKSFPERSSDVNVWWIKLLLLKVHSAFAFEKNPSVWNILINVIRS